MDKRTLELNANNVFATATRENYTFETVKGNRTVNQLWGMPITDPAGYDLTNLYSNLKKELDSCKSTGLDFLDEESTTDLNKERELKTKLEIVATIILYKKNAEKARQDELARREQAELAKKILAERKANSIKDLSDEELAKLAGN